MLAVKHSTKHRALSAEDDTVSVAALLVAAVFAVAKQHHITADKNRHNPTAQTARTMTLSRTSSMQRKLVVVATQYQTASLRSLASKKAA